MRKALFIKGKSFLLLTMLFIVFCLTGCESLDLLFSDDPAEEKDDILMPDEFKIYYTDIGLDSLYYEKCTLVGVSNDTMLYELINLLDRTPANAEYRSVKPEAVKIESYEFGADGQLILHFSSQYTDMQPIQEIICRAAIVKTLCQLPNVSYVEFYVEDQPLMLSEIPVGQMASTDFIDNTRGSAEFRQSVDIVIYLTDAEGKALKESSLIVESDGTRTIEELAVYQIISGPLPEQSGLFPVLSDKTVINKIRTVDGICYVDFNEEFYNRPENVSDEVAVYSVVNSLCEISEVTKVKISVNGEDKKNYGNIKLSELLILKPELLDIEKAGGSD